ncbi:farnesol kinase, chloroplastic-like isoform X1 [Populus nigra]|uniref:farnesol kinase, chloroplastic-like isoform X1 n=1 Tax=Populus nigra TaxID=3691 RepID=UPI002B27B907|nr:farnesol kinase, chloroplastic-like isoform X1 [Populus nigra]
MCSSRLNCSFHASPPSLRYDPHSRHLSNLKPTFILAPCQRINNGCTARFEVGFQTSLRRSRGDPTTKIAAAAMLHQNPVVSDLIATGLSGTIALSILRFFAETTKRHVFDQKLNRKLVHISIGLVFMLCWPIFSSGRQGALLAAFTPGVNIIRMLIVGSGMWKDEATVKSMSRFGDRRELLKGPLYYALTITGACAIYWRTSPVAIAAICNLCAGDGMADIVGRRFGRQKIPYNKNKSIAGSVAMALSGFVASVGFMYYFASFGYVQKSWEMLLGFLVVSLASAFVESLPISTELDDNLTVTLTSILLGNLVF